MKTSKKKVAEPGIPLTVRLPQSIIDRLESAARQVGLSRSEYVRSLLVCPDVPHPPSALKDPESRALRLGLLRAITMTQRQLEQAVRLIAQAENQKKCPPEPVDPVIKELVAIDSRLQEAIGHAFKD